jgi:hypothetical protein
MLHDARNVALKRAAAEGWKRASVTNVKKIGLQDYEVTVVVS